MAQSKSLEESLAAFVTVIPDNALNKAIDGRYGDTVRLLSLGEKVRRDVRKTPASKAAA